MCMNVSLTFSLPPPSPPIQNVKLQNTFSDCKTMDDHLFLFFVFVFFFSFGPFFDGFNHSIAGN